MEHKCGRPILPPSSDPKVQARREKARAYAEKKRQGVKQVKVETKASSTINMAIKGKIARKALEAAKAAKAPVKKPEAPAAPIKEKKARAPKKTKLTPEEEWLKTVDEYLEFYYKDYKITEQAEKNKLKQKLLENDAYFEGGVKESYRNKILKAVKAYKRRTK
jgi:hypothetical protein